jgi:hypothetical protein
MYRNSPGLPQALPSPQSTPKSKAGAQESFEPDFKDSPHVNSQTESPLGVPPPDDDEELSLSSLNSSISMPEANAQEQLSLIKTKNQELRRTATITIQDFKNTSRHLLSRSQLQSGKSSLILNELENFKKNLEGVYVDSRFQGDQNKSINMNSIECDDNLGLVYQKIQDIQKEINEAAQRLLESEKMISTTEEKNLALENRIKELEKSLNGLDVTEGPEKSRTENCLCIVT